MSLQTVLPARYTSARLGDWVELCESLEAIGQVATARALRGARYPAGRVELLRQAADNVLAAYHYAVATGGRTEPALRARELLSRALVREQGAA